MIAAENDASEICSILLSNGVDFAAVDNRANNALHLAVREGNLEVIRTLLTESRIDAEAVNGKGERVRFPGFASGISDRSVVSCCAPFQWLFYRSKNWHLAALFTETCNLPIFGIEISKL